MNDININEHINRMCVTDDVEQLKNMKKCVEKKYLILIIKN